jgi:hypothetical protein
MAQWHNGINYVPTVKRQKGLLFQAFKPECMQFCHLTNYLIIYIFPVLVFTKYVYLSYNYHSFASG